MTKHAKSNDGEIVVVDGVRYRKGEEPKPLDADDKSTPVVGTGAVKRKSAEPRNKSRSTDDK